MTNYLFLIVVLTVLTLGVSVITFIDFSLSDEQFKRLRSIVLKWPGLITLLGVIITTFDIPYGEETVTLVAAIGTFAAYCLGISSKVYDASKGDEDDD